MLGSGSGFNSPALDRNFTSAFLRCCFFLVMEYRRGAAMPSALDSVESVLRWGSDGYVRATQDTRLAGGEPDLVLASKQPDIAAFDCMATAVNKCESVEERMKLYLWLTGLDRTPELKQLFGHELDADKATRIILENVSGTEYEPILRDFKDRWYPQITD